MNEVHRVQEVPRDKKDKELRVEARTKAEEERLGHR